MKSLLKTSLVRVFKISIVSLAMGLALAYVTPSSAQQSATDPYEGLAKYEFGKSRQPLAMIEEQMRKTAPADYKGIETKLLEVLNAPQTTKDAKRFICRWLGTVGSAECVPAVAELLTDADLSHPARMALEVLPTPAAGDALRAALPKVSGKLLVGVISSIGIRRDAQAVRALSGLVNDGDSLVAGTAIAALGEIGTTEAAQALGNAKAAVPLARTVARARIVAATRLGQAGEREQSVALFKSLMDSQQPQAIRIAALKGQIGALSQGEAVKLIVEMIQGNDPAMRAATVSAFTSSSGKALKDSVARELPSIKPAGQLILMGVLADQTDVAVREPVLNVLRSASDDSVRVAALDCMTRHGEASDVALVVGLASAKAGAVADAAKRTLQRMGKPGVDDALVKLIESPRADQRATVLATLANRRVESALPTLVRLLKGNDMGLAVEAAKALSVMGKVEQLKDIAQVLAKTEYASLQAACQEAAKNICRRANDLAACGSIVVAALDQAASPSARAAFVQVLVSTGGEPALNAVLKARQDQNNEVRTAATRALVSWPEASAGPYLLELAKTSTDSSQAIVALRDGCLRLAEMEELSLAQRVKILAGVLEVAKRPEEKKRAIAALAEVPSPGSLELLQATAKDQELQSDAIRAAVKLARTTSAVYNRQTLAALEQIKAQAGSDELRKQVDVAIKAAQNAGQSPEGFIVAWMFSGPYTQEGQDGNALFDIAFAPEKTGIQANWRPVSASKSGVVELNTKFPGDNRVAYLKTEINSGKAQDAMLEMGSDDGIKVWLNGKIIHANNVVRPCTPGQDKAKIKLKEGANTLMLKVTQGAGEWAACARLRAPDGKPLEDVSVAPNAE